METYELLNLQFPPVNNIYIYNVGVRYFVWNFKGTLWNSTRNILSMHWNIRFLTTSKFQVIFDLRAHKCFWSAPCLSRCILQRGEVNFYMCCNSRRCLIKFNMMTSSNENIFRVSGHLCGEFPGQRPVTRSFDLFFDLRPNKRLSKQSRDNREAGDLRLHRAHCDVIVMITTCN